MIRKKYQRALALLLSALLLRGSMLPSQGAQVHITVDAAEYTGAVLVQESTTYVPLRHFLTFLGWEVSWDAAGACARAEKDGTAITVDPAAQCLSRDGIDLEMPIPVLRQTIYLPLRTLCALLDYSVCWDGSTRSISVTAHADDAWSEEDLYWLSRIIYAEAGGEPFSGQVAVGNVVLNRVADAEFPNSIHGVIFDTKDAVQFEPVALGTVYAAPSAGAIRAAELALRGVNTAGSSLYFFNPALSEGKWITSSRTYYKAIGSHRFYL